jgi:pimeloyl-ACP methyl ester carboxylesterase
MIRRDRLIYGTYDFDEGLYREYITREYDRCYYPEGSIRQLAALAVPGNIQPEIAAIQAPTVVIHGSEDPFYPVEIGKIIAETISNAQLVVIEGMGHSFPHEAVPLIINAIIENSNR